jgi:NitT/TauT family transport system substrate-binding protein
MQESDFTVSTVSPPYESYLLLKRVKVVLGYIDAERFPELDAKAGGAGSLSWTVYGFRLVSLVNDAL